MADRETAITAESSTRYADWAKQWRAFTQKKEFVTWAADRASKATQSRKELLEALTKYVHANGGHVTSLPGAKSIRVEAAKDSALPTKLAALGWNPIQCGASTRVTNGGIEPVDVIEVSLAK